MGFEWHVCLRKYLTINNGLFDWREKLKKNEKKSAEKFGGNEKVATFAPAKRNQR